MRRIHKYFAVGASSLLVTLVLTPAALAAGGARVSSRGAGRTATIPTTDIKGSPAAFSPSSLHATAKEPSGGTCSKTYASFLMLNKESKNEKVAFTGTGGLKGTVIVPAKEGEYICVTKGYTGTLTGKLSDGKKLTVKF